MDRTAPNTTPLAAGHDTASALRPDQREAFDGLLLALLARKRLLLLVGDAGSGRTAVFRRLVEQVAADGALVLPVIASPGAQVEDLISAAGDVALPCDDVEERDFETLVEALEERLDLAGAGMLAVDNAGVLAAPVLADLIDLTRSETPSGRFLQVLLCGTPEMERGLARPGLADAVRDIGVIYRMIPGAGPSVVPSMAPPCAPVTESRKDVPHNGGRPRGKAERGNSERAVTPPAELRAQPDDRLAPDRPANDWDAPGGWSIPDALGAAPDSGTAAMGRSRSRRLLAGAAMTTLVLLAAAGTAVTLAPPGSLPDDAERALQRGWADLRATVEAHSPLADPSFAADQGPDRQFPTRKDGAGLAGSSTPAEPVSDPLPATGRSQPQRSVSASSPSPPSASPPKDVKVAKADPAAPTTTPGAPAKSVTPALPTPMLPDPFAAAAPPPHTRVDPADAPAGTATLPPLVDEETAAAEGPRTNTAAPPPSGSTTPPMQSVQPLLDQARRQLAAKRLTTPPGDNAYETLSHLRAIAPNMPEVGQLLSTLENTYRRWAAMAERDGNWDDARRFYGRALTVNPGDADLRARVQAAGEHRVLAAAPGGQAGTDSPSTSPDAAAGAAAGAGAAPEVTPGLDNRDAAIALLRRPADLARALDGGADPDKRVDNGKTLLMLAAEQGLPDAVRILLSHHARTEVRTADGATAVMYAAWGGSAPAIQALATAGADLDATNVDGKTALMAAAARGHQEAVQALLDHGVTVDRVADHGWSALMYAANNGYDRIVRQLVARGANPFRMDSAGNSALTLGALQGHMQVVEALKPH